MRSLNFGMAIVLIAAAFLPVRAQTAAATALRFARVWDGEKTIPNAVVVVREGKIVSVSNGGGVPAGAQSIDLRCCTGIPGLIDLHTHMTYYWDRAPGTRPLNQPRRNLLQRVPEFGSSTPRRGDRAHARDDNAPGH